MNIFGKIITKDTNAKSVMNKSENTWLSNFSTLTFASIMLGVNDWDNAPSPKKLRKTLGILKTTTKISWIVLAPKSDENSRSLTYPKTLEIRVKNEKPADAFQNLDIFNYFSLLQNLMRLNLHNISSQ